MARVKLTFHGTDKSETQEHKLECFSNTNNEIYLCIDMPNWQPSFICLDKSTSIRLVRELKKHIGYLESEVKNG